MPQHTLYKPSDTRRESLLGRPLTDLDSEKPYRSRARNRRSRPS